MSVNTSSRDRAARLIRDPALVILTVTALVHLIRGAPVDALIFFVVVVALAVTEWLSGPTTGRIAKVGRKVGRVEAVVVTCAAVVFGIGVGSWTIFSAPVAWVMVVIGVVAVTAVWQQPVEPAELPPEPALAGWGALSWVVLALAWCAWEVVSFVHEVNVADVSIGHPTLSDIVQPVLAYPTARWLVLAAWVAAGYGMVRVGRRVVR